MFRRNLVKAGVIIGISAALAVPSMAMAGHRDNREYADVVEVTTLYRYVEVQVPHRECWDEVQYIDVPKRHRGRHHYRGSAGATITGGIIGGVIGRQFGDGDGRDAMTVVGTLVGAAIGNDIHRSRHRDRGYVRHHVRTETVTRCTTSYSTEERREVDGYLVTYRYNGRRYRTRMDDRPGNRIPINVEVSPAVGA